jgi:hypothetical protein
MEQNTQLFSLSVDPTAKLHLGETAKWARFLAIVGMVSLALIVIAGIYLATVMTSMQSRLDDEFGGRTNPFASGMGIGMAALYLILALIWFFPLLFLLRFANQMRSALAADNQELLNASFQNLKACMRYVGIITLIILVIYALVFIIGIVTAATLA